MTTLKKFILAVVAAVILAPAAYAQNYDQLLRRFVDGQQLTPSEFAEVYYGAPAQKGFSATRDFSAAMQAYNVGDTKKAYRLVSDGLKQDPTNLLLLFKAYALATSSTDMDVKQLAPKYQTRLLGICDAIFNSGKGVMDSSPYRYTHVTDLDEFIVKYLQPTTIVGRSKIGQVEAIKMRLDGMNEDVILYFQLVK